MAVVPHADPLLILAVILAVGMGLGWLAQRMGLPAITGQILAGVLLGPAALQIFEPEAVDELQPLTHFALALIGVTVGAHLNLSRLRNAGKRLSFLLLAECTITPLVVAVALLLLTDIPLTLVVLLAPLGISTAPATIIAMVRETRSRGVFVKTLIASVAINNLACILLFEAAHAAMRLGVAEGLTLVTLLPMLLEPAYEILGAGALGTAAALGAHLMTLRVVRPERLATLSAISIPLTFGLASWASLSPLLACMALGAVQTNLNPERDRLVDSVFANFEPAILCAFFTLAGMNLSFEGAGIAGGVALVFFAGRALGKLVAADLSMRVAGATDRVRRSLGLALLPQAGIAIGLVILIKDDPLFVDVEALFVAVVLTAVLLNEIVGPLTTRFALQRAGEVGNDRPRLVDFLGEENIVTGLEAESIEESIEKLTDLLISSHHLRVDRRALVQSVLDREREMSTCLGGGAAVPHGELPEGLPMVGVMGISRRGLPFDTPDGQPVHCVVLLATPRGERDRHLEVLGTLARTLGSDLTFQQQLYNARSPAHVWELLHGEATEDFNYFLEPE